ncbi:MAG: hypothetical protein OEV80_06855, partial [candidate division Zixibacteria bacterium]|nr:hypothetical protein [candidate division Zixibacteria bacterium]
MKATRYITVMFIPDGAEARRGYRVRAWVLKAVLWALAILLVGQVFFFAFYADVLKRAALTDK